MSSSQHNMEGGKWVTGGYSFFRMHNLIDVYFTGGFGTVQVSGPVIDAPLSASSSFLAP